MYILLQTFIDKISPLSDEEHFQIQKICQVRSYCRFEKLNMEGQPEEYFHFVAKGIIRKFSKKDDEDITVLIVQEGGFICADITIFGEQPTHYQLETLEPTTTLSIPKKSFMNLYDQYKGIQKLTRSLLLQLLILSEKHEVEQAKYPLINRMERYLRSHPQFMQRVPQKILASFLNIQPETFSRVKSKLKAKQYDMSEPFNSKIHNYGL